MWKMSLSHIFFVATSVLTNKPRSGGFSPISEYFFSVAANDQEANPIGLSDSSVVVCVMTAPTPWGDASVANSSGD